MTTKISAAGQKIYDTATIAFKKLDTKPNDVVVVYFPPDIDSDQMILAAREMQDQAIQHEILLICSSQGASVEHFSEAELNQQGWYKIDSPSTTIQ